jgi:hypothetical protein
MCNQCQDPLDLIIANDILLHNRICIRVIIMKEETITKLGDITFDFYEIAKKDEECKEFALKMMSKISNKINSERDKE